MNIKAYISGFAALLIALVASGAKPSIKIALDSSYIEMGRQTPLHVTVTDRNGEAGAVVVPFDSVPREVEFVDMKNLPQLQADESVPQVFTATYKIQSFDSGVYRIPPLMYVNDKADTVFSNGVTLKVLPVDVSELQDINPSEPAQQLGSKWFDWIPDFITDYWLYYLLGILIIAGAICAYLLLTKKVTVSILPQKKPRPPYDVAIEKLEHLKSEQLWEKGQEKEFYTELTDILREYLDHRFGINAMEMTTTQILNAIRSREETAMTEALMRQILEVADFVKFAKVQPLREDNIKSFDAALRFVEDTKPQEAPADEDEDNKDNIKQKS